MVKGRFLWKGRTGSRQRGRRKGHFFYTENGGSGKLTCSTNILGTFLILIALSVASYKKSTPPVLKNKGNF